jgi:hypothetical protein
VLHNPSNFDESNDASILQASFSAFSHQLLSLLGIPQLPSGIRDTASDSSIREWQLDALLRRRTLENAKGSQDTLKSIIKLVDQIENMPVGQDVKGDVEDALEELTKVRTHYTTGYMIPDERNLDVRIRHLFAPTNIPPLSFSPWAGVSRILQSWYVSAALLSRRTQVRSIYSVICERCHSVIRGCFKGVESLEASTQGGGGDGSPELKSVWAAIWIT